MNTCKTPSKARPIRLLKQNKDGTFRMNYFREAPPYAILSHTWGPTAHLEEINFDDLRLSPLPETVRQKAGYAKLLFCAQRARIDRLQYFWIDSCCINKRDSSELQRSINSMYSWYEHAVKCYVYLQDVDPIGAAETTLDPLYWSSMVPGSKTNLIKNVQGGRSDQLADGILVELEQSRWFTRGWTLLELIAPSIVEFFTAKGHLLGTKKSLCNMIASVTNIPREVLDTSELTGFTLEERLKWVHARQTLEEEDLAYCMMGVLDVWIEVTYGLPSGIAMLRLKKGVAEASSTPHQTTASASEPRMYVQSSGAERRMKSLGFKDTNDELSQTDDDSHFASSSTATERTSTEQGIRAMISKEQAYNIASRIDLRVGVVFIVLIFLSLLPGFEMTKELYQKRAFDHQIDASLPVFAILGKTGVGKSTFIETLGGRHIETGQQPVICTSRVDFYTADLYFGSAYLIDTPGFDDSNGRKDSEILQMIFQQLNNLYNGDKLVKGIIFLYDIGAYRIRGQTFDAMNELQVLCGVNNIRNVVLATTRWTKGYDRDELTKQWNSEKELADTYWKKAIQRGSNIERYLGTKESAMAVLTILNSREPLFDPTEPLKYLGKQDSTTHPKFEKKNSVDERPSRWIIAMWYMWLLVQLIAGYFLAIVGIDSTTRQPSLPIFQSPGKIDDLTIDGRKVTLINVYVYAVTVLSYYFREFFPWLWSFGVAFAWSSIGVAALFVYRECKSSLVWNCCQPVSLLVGWWFSG